MFRFGCNSLLYLVFFALCSGSLNQTENNRRSLYHKEENGKKAAWRNYEIVDGVKNEDVAILITSTIAKDASLQFQRIIPSSRTWMKDFANVFVIFEDNFSSRFSLRHCEKKETKEFTVFECPDEPTYVLSRQCTNIYYGASGPCCKVDDIFNYITNHNEELYSHLKYVLHGDDDSYFRVKQILRFFGSIEKAGFAHFPLIGNPATTLDESRLGGIWHIINCKEVRTMGWYQPLMINKPALELMKVAFANYGIRDTCQSFDVTHDVGVGPFFWLFEPYHIQLPHVDLNGRHGGYAVLTPTQMIMHCVKVQKFDKCVDDLPEWPDNARYQQNMVIGCGDIEKPNPIHDKMKNIDMYDAHKYYREHGQDTEIGVPGVSGYRFAKVLLYPEGSGRPESERIKEILEYDSLNQKEKPTNVSYGKPVQPGETVEWRLVPTIKKLTGYKETKHAKNNDLSKKWVKFTTADCDPPGYPRGKEPKI